MPRRGRRRGRANAPDRVDPNLTPLLDIVLQLITFFMMLVHFGTRIEGATRAVRLPTTPAALPGSDLGLDRLAVDIDAQGRLTAAERASDDAGALAPWAELARSRRPAPDPAARKPPELPTVVVIRADRDVPYGTVRRALAAAEAAGFVHFTLVVLREPAR